MLLAPSAGLKVWSADAYAKLAQAHGLNTNMVFKWRRRLRAGLVDGEGPIVKPELLAVTMVSEPTPSAAPATTSTSPAIEIEINGAHVRVIGMVDPMQLGLVLRCLMPA